MLIFVLICNGIIFLVNCYLFLQILKLRKRLNQIANTLESLERKVPLLLKIALLKLRQSEYQTLTLRKKYGTLQQKWAKLLTLIQFLKCLYKQYRSWG